MTGTLEFILPILSGVAGGLAAWGLGRLARRTCPGRHGWRQIRPSSMHWTALVGSASLSALVLYVRLFVGSARADAETQMMWASLVAAAFGIGAVASLWQIRRITAADVFWRGSTLCYRSGKGQERTRSMTEVAGMHRRWSGTIAVVFEDGDVLELDQNATGTEDLCERIIAVNDGPLTE